MAKSISRFTDRRIQQLKPAEKTYMETEPDGLYIRVFPSGKKSFLTVFSFDGKQQWLTLGRYPDLSLARARKKISEIREQVANGINPTLEKQQQRAERINAPTVEQFAAEYLKRWAYRHKKSAKEDERILHKDVIPHMGKMKLQDVTRRDVIALIDAVAERGSIMANRTLAVIRKMFSFAINRGVIETTPCMNIDPPGKEVKKDRFLSSAEIKTLWPLMTKLLTDQTNRAIKMILATAQRPGEVASMRWEEIDGQWWTIPSSKTKNGREHRVYLNSIALELMGEPKTTGYVFQSLRSDKAIHPNAFGKALRSQMENFKDVGYFSAHDLRRTAATHIAELGHGLIVGKILNHTDVTVTAVYNRYAYDQEIQAAMLAWGRKIETLITGKQSDKVVQLRA